MQKAPSGATVPITVVTVPQQTISPTFQESTGSAAGAAPPPPGPAAAQLPVEAAAIMATAQVVAAVAATAGNAAVEFGQFGNPQALAQLESDKRAVYRHPLFPLLALLFEKCELATQSTECPSSDGFDVDIEAFVQHQEQDRKPFFSDDSEVDALMVKAIQVLRIHLLELEKVQELCKDFCTRYITCLKSKMQSENLLRSDYPASSSYGNSSPSSDSGDSRHSVHSVVVNSNSNSMSNSMTVIHPGSAVSTHVVSGGTVYQMVQTPQGIVAQPIQIQTSTPVQPAHHHASTTTTATTTALHAQQEQQHAVHGQTPLSQIGSGGHHMHRESDSLGSLLQAEPSTPTSQEEDDDILGRKKQKRGVLPKQATSVMRSWLFQHIVHPYPTEDEKKQIAAQTSLTLLQVNNWFINARRRILQPMLDASNPDSSHKAKKAKTQSSRPVQRFWPENIASLQPQLLLQGGVSKSDSESKSGSAKESDITSTTEHPVDGSLKADSRNGDIDADDDSSLDGSPGDVGRSASALSLDCDSDSSGMGD